MRDERWEAENEEKVKRGGYDGIEMGRGTIEELIRMCSVCVCVFECTRSCVYRCICLLVCECVCVCVYVYACAYVCMSV